MTPEQAKAQEREELRRQAREQREYEDLMASPTCDICRDLPERALVEGLYEVGGTLAILNVCESCNIRFNPDGIDNQVPRTPKAGQGSAGGFQGTLGEEYATGEQLGMTLGGDKGYKTPRGDEEGLQDKEARRRMRAKGQQDIPGL